jgi:hypothetical protein
MSDTIVPIFDLFILTSFIPFLYPFRFPPLSPYFLPISSFLTLSAFPYQFGINTNMEHFTQLNNNQI